MIQIPDHPVIRSLEETGYPPWMRDDWEDNEDDD